MKKITIMEEERNRSIGKILSQSQTTKERDRFSGRSIHQPLQKGSLPSISYNPAPVSIKTVRPMSDESKALDYEKRRNEVMPRMNQQNRQVKDSLGYRWIKYKLYGAIDTIDTFYTYGGANEINLGKCYNCNNSKT